MCPVRLVQPVTKTGCDKLQVAGCQAQASACDAEATLLTASASGTSARQRRTRLRGAHRAPGHDHHRLQSRGQRRSGGRRRRHRSRRRPCSEAATLSGWPSISVASASDVEHPARTCRLGRQQAGHDPGGARAEAAAQRDRGADPELETSAGCRRSNARTIRFSRSRRRFKSVTTAKLPVSTTSSSR